MRNFISTAICVLVIGFASLNLGSALAEEVVAAKGKANSNKILALRQGSGAYSRADIEFMVRIVFADAMNPQSWVTDWVRKNHIPSLTHLLIHQRRNHAGSIPFTVLTLPEWANHRVVVVNGFQGNPCVRRWMSIDALQTYFRKFTTTQGKIRIFQAGFLGLKGFQMGLDLKNLLDDLHAQGLMRTRLEPPLSEREERENTILKSALSRKSRG